VRRHYQISKEQFGIVPVVRCKAWNLRGTEYVMTKVGIRRAFRNKAREFGRPDLVHAHFGLYGGVAALELKQRFGIPFVLTEHSTGYANGMIPGGMVFVLRDVFKPAERVIVVSQALLGSVSPYCAGADVIPNTVDTDFFGSVQPKLSSRFEITSVGGLREVKDSDVLLDAYARLARVKAGVHLNIVGEGDLLCDLQNQVKDLNISDIVTFHGHLSRGDLRDLLRSSDLRGVNARAAMVERYGPQAIGDRLDGLYREVARSLNR
jgi:glycosyltransferase involved in cell wall biosynthesis